MLDVNMLPDKQILLRLLILYVSLSVVLSTQFNITLQTPSNASSPTITPHKLVHVKYTLPDESDLWAIVGVVPLIQTHRKAVERLTVHICNPLMDQSIWYDDETNCDDAQSMLIYEWTPYSSLAPFRISNENGFQLNKLKSIVLTVTYKKEKRVHKEQSGIMLYISIQKSKLRMGTVFVGNKQKGARFSCRSSTDSRLLYGIKQLNSNANNILWRMYVIRFRQFGRKSVQLIFDSKLKSNPTKSDIEIASSDVFLLQGDYLLIECEGTSQSNCYFLLYYTYKSKSIKNDNTCRNNEFPDLFKLVPSREIAGKNNSTTNSSSTKGSTIFLSICILLLVIWISIIIGCIIMRRICGLQNFRTKPMSSLPSKKTKFSPNARQATADNYHQRTGDADHIMQIDGEHAGFAS